MERRLCDPNIIINKPQIQMTRYKGKVFPSRHEIPSKLIKMTTRQDKGAYICLSERSITKTLFDNTNNHHYRYSNRYFRRPLVRHPPSENNKYLLIRKPINCSTQSIYSQFRMENEQSYRMQRFLVTGCNGQPPKWQ